ncbi:hypothetical protein EJ08DRAFT_437103 [Tothia fuscella]|uniref:Uncharacterized protein n=1 Tax=Tothia fuscella TaxID=1048955 RepID=A0A9P4U1P8_9PEZI|nr:hypothetical protein EJ08DRAFT_437103 [Tothia fuscella]
MARTKSPAYKITKMPRRIVSRPKNVRNRAHDSTDETKDIDNMAALEENNVAASKPTIKQEQSSVFDSNETKQQAKRQAQCHNNTQKQHKATENEGAETNEESEEIPPWLTQKVNGEYDVVDLKRPEWAFLAAFRRAIREREIEKNKKAVEAFEVQNPLLRVTRGLRVKGPPKNSPPRPQTRPAKRTGLKSKRSSQPQTLHPLPTAPSIKSEFQQPTHHQSR